MKKWSLYFLFLLSPIAFGQNQISQLDEDSLVILLGDLRGAADNQSKKEKNDAFKAMFSKVLAKDNALSYSFASLTTVGCIDSPDGQVRIINWNVEQDDQSQRYYGYVLHRNKKKEIVVTELIEDVFGAPRPDDVVEANAWYGALYYRIIPFKKGSKDVYTVLGWDGNTSLSNIKLIDALYINGNSVKFGSPVFKIGKETKKRIFYEHSEKATMYLNYEEDRQRIMMDHLSPETPSMKGFYSFYVPDLSYDAFYLEGGKWVLHEDVIGVNDADEEKEVVYTMDPKTGKLVEKKIKNEWKNPEDTNAPGGGLEHVAVTPEGESENKSTEKKDPNEPKSNKKDKRDPNQLSTVQGNSKNKRKKK